MPNLQSVAEHTSVSSELAQVNRLAETLSARMALINALQSSLAIDEQLQSFYTWLQNYVAVDSVAYQHDQHAISIAIGNPAKHSCNYTMNTQLEHLGAIHFTRSKRFKEEELKQIEDSLTALLFPIRNALQYRLAVQTAMIDPLTGAGNRLALDNALHRELQLSERYSQDLSLLMIDIDYFKNINDVHGHSIGDEVLKQVARTLRDVIRETDMTFRYGGEEFVVVLTKTNLDGAAVIAERIRLAIAAQIVTVEDQIIPTTVSVGYSSLHNNEHVKSLFDRADKALYKAKVNGRNRIEKVN